MSRLIAHWKGENNLVDSIGGNNGTLVQNGGLFSYDVGYVDNSWKWAGAVANYRLYITTPNSPVYQFASAASFSVECYLNFSQFRGSGVILCQGDSLASRNWTISIPTRTQISINYNGSNNFSEAVPTMSTGVWYRLKVSYDGGTGVWKIYLNTAGATEALVATHTQAITISNTTWGYCIGGIDSINTNIMGQIDELKIYNDNLPPVELFMIKELDVFLAKLQTARGTPDDDLDGEDYLLALPDSKVEVITQMTDIETVSAKYDQDIAVRGMVNANVALSTYVRSLGAAVAPDYATLAQAAGFVLAGPTDGIFTLTPITAVSDATTKDLEVFHYSGGVGTDASVLTKVGNVVGDWKLSADVGKPAVFALTGGKGIYISQAAATMVVGVVKDRTLIPPVLPLTVSINGVTYKVLKFEFSGGNSVEQFIDCAATYGFGQSEITKKKISFSFTAYANAALANPLDAVIAGAVVDDVVLTFGTTARKTELKATDPQFTDCKVGDAGGLTTWEVTGNCTQNNFLITQNSDYVA